MSVSALRDSAKHLPASIERLDVADANLQMPFAVVDSYE